MGTSYLSDGAHVVKKFGGAEAPTTKGFEPKEEKDSSVVGITPTDDNELVSDDTSSSQYGYATEDENPMNLEAPMEVDNSTAIPRTVVDAGFTLVDGDHKVFSREFAPAMERPSYIGNTNMILEYLFKEERKHKVTLPVRACGIDPIVFDYVERISAEGGTTDYFSIKSSDSETDCIYELIEVDGELYMSCMSECLDDEYMHSIITHATTTIMETGRYIFRMVGLKKLANEDSGNTGKLLYTLRLNTYEMSALCSYMSDFGIEPSFEIIDGHKCICFRMVG